MGWSMLSGDVPGELEKHLRSNDYSHIYLNSKECRNIKRFLFTEEYIVIVTELFGVEFSIDLHKSLLRSAMYDDNSLNLTAFKNKNVKVFDSFLLKK